MGEKANRLPLCALVGVVLCVLLSACVCTATLQVEPAHADTAKKSGWVKSSGHKYYYKAGSKVTGMQKIGKNYYYFNKKGVMKTGTVKSGKTTYYMSSNGHMEAYKKGSTFYKPTGKKMAAYEAKEYKCQLKAREYLKKLQRAKKTKSEQLLACFKWVQKGYYNQYRKFTNKVGWSADFANDHFITRRNGFRYGDCISDSAAFAYLALAIGYDDVRIGVDTAQTSKNAHGCARINGKYYDPLFAEVKSFHKYYGHYTGVHLRSVRIVVPSAENGYTTSIYYGQKPSGADSDNATNIKPGLSKVNGSYYYYTKAGKKVKSTWKTVGKARYYFKSNGRAATGPIKIKGTWYVFSKSGKLQTGSGVHTVKVGSDTYRVTKGGKAKAGWNDAKTKLYLENGRQARGLSVYKGKLYYFKDGKYNAEKTSAIRKAAVKNADATDLLKLIGTPKSKTQSAGCNPVTDENGQLVWGDDIVYTYKNATLEFFKGENGITYYIGCSKPDK